MLNLREVILEASESQMMVQEELGSPALAFAKTISAALALDTGVTDDVAIMRRSLLKLCQIREFSPAAMFQVTLQHPLWDAFVTLESAGVPCS